MGPNTIAMNPEQCPNMFWHEWIRDPWPLPQRPHCKWCGRYRPEDSTQPVYNVPSPGKWS